MKALSGTSKSMIQVANTTSTVFEALKKKEISDILSKNPKLTKHRVCVNFNSPPDGQKIEVKVNLYGPETAKLRPEAYEFKS